MKRPVIPMMPCCLAYKAGLSRYYSNLVEVLRELNEDKEQEEVAVEAQCAVAQECRGAHQRLP